MKIQLLYLADKLPLIERSPFFATLSVDDQHTAKVFLDILDVNRIIKATYLKRNIFPPLMPLFEPDLEVGILIGKAWHFLYNFFERNQRPPYLGFHQRIEIVAEILHPWKSGLFTGSSTDLLIVTNGA